ncbi:MAG: pyridoxal phosphate-dependent transferase [Benjaminiella poitrasii]|nr:MAG: pyridoxal phosphate-dependent transferase [Benjaminiella poitrasii]
MTINFFNGQPSADILPTELFAKATQKVFSASNAANDVLQYGHEYGHPNFLKNLAEFLTVEYSSPVSHRHLCATPGASLSLQHILSLLTRPQSTTHHVYFQDPTYFLVFSIFLDLGYTREQFVAIPDSSSGLDVDMLEQYLIQHDRTDDKSDMIFNSILYCVPTHANPTGSVLSNEKRERIVQLGRKYNMLIICDDVYDMLTFRDEIPKRVVAYDLEQEGNHVVISNGSFSKILAPGARAGWIEAGETIINKLGAWYVTKKKRKRNLWNGGEEV